MNSIQRIARAPPISRSPQPAGGILRTVKLTRAASEDELLAAARRHRDWMLRGRHDPHSKPSPATVSTRDTEAAQCCGLLSRSKTRERPHPHHSHFAGRAHRVPARILPIGAPRTSARITEELIPEVCSRRPGAAYCDAFLRRSPLSPYRRNPHRCLRQQSSTDSGIRVQRRTVSFWKPGAALWPRNWAPRPSDHLETATEEKKRCFQLPRCRACSRFFCLARSSHLGRTQYPPAAQDGRVGPRPRPWPRTSIPAPHLCLPCHSCSRLPAFRWVLSPAEALSAATINAAWSPRPRNDRRLSRDRKKSRLHHSLNFGDYRELAYFIACVSARPRVFIEGREATVTSDPLAHSARIRKCAAETGRIAERVSN